MPSTLGGIHHVTAIGGDAQRTVDFYTGVLGLRLVKRTVNFDAPDTYHLYFGDEMGRPGTIMTFFSWPGGSPGRPGTGQVTAVSFAIPPAGLRFWTERLAAHGIAAGRLERFDEHVLSFHDPDGLPLELVAPSREDPRGGGWSGPVPREAAISGVFGVTLTEARTEPTGAFLEETLGFHRLLEEGPRSRFAAGPPGREEAGGPGALLDLVHAPNEPRGTVAVGTMHHVAWRTPDDGEQRVWRQQIDVMGHGVTPILDRLYFHSIYFKEPGGALFEIATDPPGFTVDEAPDRLGEGLCLPPWLDQLRDRLEQELPPLRLPGAPKR